MLHLFFIVSRPEETGFINPRSDAKAVLSALEQHYVARSDDQGISGETATRTLLLLKYIFRSFHVYFLIQYGYHIFLRLYMI